MNTHIGSLSKIKTIKLAITLFIATVFIMFPGVSSAVSPASATSAYTFIIDSSNQSRTKDVNGRPVLKAKNKRGGNTLSLDASVANTTSVVPVGTIIFLDFPGGPASVKIGSPKGVLKAPAGSYHTPPQVVGVLVVALGGVETITVAQASSSPKSFNSALSNSIWSGYVRQGAPGSATKLSGEWDVPIAYCGSGLTSSSTWVGLDHLADNLLQTGTKSWCDENNQPHYQAWWELLPDSEVIVSCSVHSGDHMHAEINPSSSGYDVILRNITQNVDCSQQGLNYDGPLETAEWITERPSYRDSNGNVVTYPLANYGLVTFSHDTFNGASAAHNYATDSVQMTSDGTSSSTILSKPSSPNFFNDAFNTLYCDPVSGCPSVNPPANWVQSGLSATPYEQLNAVAAAGSSIWAAGWERAPSFYHSPLVYKYNKNNGSWGKYILPNPDTAHFDLYGIATNNSDDTWAVGYAGNNNGTIAYHWDGAQWRRVTSDNPAGVTRANRLYGVAIDGSGTPWAVGDYWTTTAQLPLIEKWNGTKFEQQMLTLPSGYTNGSLSTVSFTSSTNGWAIGGALIYHYDGSSWTPSVLPLANSSIKSIYADSDADAWGIGYAANGTAPLVAHYSNGSWSSVSITGYPSGTVLQSVTAISPSDVWVVGNYDGTWGPLPLTMHYDGLNWTRVNPPSIALAGLNGVAAYSGSIWAVGFSQSYSYPSPYIIKSN